MNDKQYRMMTQVAVKERWLRLPNASEDEENSKFKTCNLLMKYNQTMSEETMSKIIMEARSAPIGKDNDLIDFRAFMTIGENAHRVGPNIPEDFAQMAPPISRGIFDEIFNKEQRTGYISYETGRSITSNVRAMADALRPHSILFPDYACQTNIPINNPNGLHAAVLHGYTIEGDGLHLPVEALYNYDILAGSPSEQSGSKLGLYMVMGPGNDVLCGETIGNGRGYERQVALDPTFTMGVRRVKKNTTTIVPVYDQKVGVCFYLAKEKETHHKVASDLINVCKYNTRSRVADRMSKDLAVIKLGSLLLDQERSHSEIYTQNGVQTVILHNFNFTPDRNWSVFPFVYKKEDFSVNEEADINSVPAPTDDYSADFYAEGAQMYAQQEEDDDDEEQNNYNPMLKLIGEASSGVQKSAETVYTAMPDVQEPKKGKTVEKALSKMRYGGSITGRESKPKSKVKQVGGPSTSKALDLNAL
ncbi:hypothetical protein AbHV_ORF81 [Abalone herpesvirus Victoria/AUS/2009]|uniref:Uncharacterized protein n=2 Tax=Aurivirus haliotidmalaco1 TaxID=3050290 RepID=K4JYJ4_ABHV|nr:hypothetical protein AbHV_ORF81 [Abalone herpesvirus Victoria/AUS/2009]ADP36921.1 p073c [Abalone herpesvirus Victoria/AUS/2007]AFU90093.1 hypothetical protein AbHV_ORF81 [Abalone herpesvirus Victoria/AUS/2009]